MRELPELIVMVRGGGEVGTAIAHRLYRSHLRVCITEIEFPLSVNRGVCFSEAVYDGHATVEGINAERTTSSLEQIYGVWRKNKIPVVIDPELKVKALLKPDVLVNAMMLKRETNTKISDAALVIGIGAGFTAGDNVHLVVESECSNNLGKVLIEGSAEEDAGYSEATHETLDRVILADDSGIFMTEKDIGDTVTEDEIIGNLADIPVIAPVNGILRGILRDKTKVLANAVLAEIDTVNDKSICFAIRSERRAIAGGVLEAIMMSFNAKD